LGDWGYLELEGFEVPLGRFVTKLFYIIIMAIYDDTLMILFHDTKAFKKLPKKLPKL
jgi:hypothetical protein